MMKQNATLFNRFGFGLDFASVRTPTDVEGWLTSHIDPKATIVRGHQPELTSRDAVLRVVAAQKDGKMARKEVRKSFAVQSVADAKATLSRAIHSKTPFAERWVQFWLNHFTVSTLRKEVRGLTGAFEREVVRTHAFGQFSALLLHATRHPAMLLYLDNVRSVGPRSQAGRKNRGLNENLAREILELHTVGPQGGYDQTDVEQFARLLTGWSVNRDVSGAGDAFLFRPRAHEPGKKKVLGVWYPEGEKGGVQCLRDLAGLDQTAAFIAGKLARHFVSEFPSKKLVAALTHSFRKTNGDLKALARTLVHHPDAQLATRAKVRSPFEWVVGMAQASQGSLGVDDAFRALRQLNQVPFSAPSPKGWPEKTASWIGPEATLDRLDVAERFGRLMSRSVGPSNENLSGWLDTASENTRAILGAVNNPIHRWALFVLSPEFQRR